MKKAWVLSYPLSSQRRFWSDWVDSQADLCLCWAHSQLFGFVMRRLICLRAQCANLHPSTVWITLLHWLFCYCAFMQQKCRPSSENSTKTKQWLVKNTKKQIKWKAFFYYFFHFWFSLKVGLFYKFRTNNLLIVLTGFLLFFLLFSSIW